jgi:hypothetical protein
LIIFSQAVDWSHHSRAMNDGTTPIAAAAVRLRPSSAHPSSRSVGGHSRSPSSTSNMSTKQQRQARPSSAMSHTNNNNNNTRHRPHQSLMDFAITQGLLSPTPPPGNSSPPPVSMSRPGSSASVIRPTSARPAVVGPVAVAGVTNNNKDSNTNNNPVRATHIRTVSFSHAAPPPHTRSATPLSSSSLWTQSSSASAASTPIPSVPQSTLSYELAQATERLPAYKNTPAFVDYLSRAHSLAHSASQGVLPPSTSSTGIATGSTSTPSISTPTPNSAAELAAHMVAPEPERNMSVAPRQRWLSSYADRVNDSAGRDEVILCSTLGLHARVLDVLQVLKDTRAQLDLNFEAVNTYVTDHQQSIRRPPPSSSSATPTPTTAGGAPPTTRSGASSQPSSRPQSARPQSARPPSARSATNDYISSASSSGGVGSGGNTFLTDAPVIDLTRPSTSHSGRPLSAAPPPSASRISAPPSQTKATASSQQSSLSQEPLPSITSPRYMDEWIDRLKAIQMSLRQHDADERARRHHQRHHTPAANNPLETSLVTYMNHTTDTTPSSTNTNNNTTPSVATTEPSPLPESLTSDTIHSLSKDLFEPVRYSAVRWRQLMQLASGISDGNVPSLPPPVLPRLMEQTFKIMTLVLEVQLQRHKHDMNALQQQLAALLDAPSTAGKSPTSTGTGNRPSSAKTRPQSATNNRRNIKQHQQRGPGDGRQYDDSDSDESKTGDAQNVADPASAMYSVGLMLQRDALRKVSLVHT